GLPSAWSGACSWHAASWRRSRRRRRPLAAPSLRSPATCWSNTRRSDHDEEAEAAPGALPPEVEASGRDVGTVGDALLLPVRSGAATADREGHGRDGPGGRVALSAEA